MQMAGRIPPLSIGLVVLAVIVGYAVGQWRDGPMILTGRADTTAEGGGSISTDDWTYAFASEVDWIDENNTWHSSERVGCLQPGGSATVRFAAVEVSIEGSTWRPVVWIDCRSVADE